MEKRELIEMTETELTVRLVETDPYGIANNAEYYVWFEIGRFDYGEKSGINLNDMFSTEVVHITLSSECKYLKSCKLGDVLVVKTKMEPHKMYCTYDFEQELYNKKTGELMATSNAKVAVIYMKTGKILQWSEYDKNAENFKNYQSAREKAGRSMLEEKGINPDDLVQSRLAQAEVVKQELADRKKSGKR